MSVGAFPDPAIERRRQVDMWKEHIRQGGTPPFSSSPEWELANREMSPMNYGQQIPQFLLAGLTGLLRGRRKK